MDGTGVSLLEAIRAARSVRGVPSHLKHALLVLATYYPDPFPGLDRIAGDLGVSRGAAAQRLHDLGERGLIETTRRGRGKTARRTLTLPGLTSSGPDVIAAPEGLTSGGPDEQTSSGPDGKGKNEEQGSSLRQLPDLVEEVANVLRPLGPINVDDLREGVAAYARNREHALDVAREIGDHRLASAALQGVTEFFVARLRRTQSACL